MTTAARPAPTAAGYAAREVTKPPNWHELVVVDVVLNAAATGLFLVTAVAELARPGVFGPVAAWANPLTLVLLLADLSCLVLDLGDPLRFHHMLRVFKLRSPMSLGTWCLTAFSFPLALLAVLDVFGLVGWLPADAGWVAASRTVLVVAALPFAFGSAAYKGVLFSTTAQPGWRDARWLGAYHVTSALALGCGLLWAVAGCGGYERATDLLRPALAALVAVSLLPAYRLSVELRPAMSRAYSGETRRAVAAVVIGGSFVLPAVLAVFGGAVSAIAAAAGLLAGAYTSRGVITHLPHRGLSH